MPAPTRLALSTAVDSSGAPPSSFRLFTRGVVSTSKGKFTFDDAAAASVLAAAKLQGHRYVLDLEHGSLDGGRTDALAYFSIAMKADGLHAVDVRWTAEGVERLTSKKQIFISPAFLTDDKGHVTELLNAALTSQPATYNSLELVAASRYGRASSTMLGARVTSETAQVFRLLAKQSRTTPGALIRRLLVSLAAAPADAADSSLVAIRNALGLEPDAGRAEIVEALDALFTLIGGDPADAAPIDPMASAADMPPPAKLSRAELAAMTPADRGRHQIAADAARRAARAASDPLRTVQARRR